MELTHKEKPNLTWISDPEALSSGFSVLELTFDLSSQVKSATWT